MPTHTPEEWMPSFDLGDPALVFIAAHFFKTKLGY
jgi:hypothetical protein